MSLLHRDMMHNLFVSGVACDLIGSSIVFLREHGFLGARSPDGAYRLFWLEYRAWCKAHNVSSSTRVFSRTLLNRTSRRMYPCLSTQYKAAHTKTMCAFVATAAHARADGSEDMQLLAACTWGLADFLWALDHQGHWLTDEAAERACSSATVCLQTYSVLASRALAQGVCNFKVRPKFHYFNH